MICAKELRQLKERLIEEDLVLKIRYVLGSAFFSCPGETGDAVCTPLVEATSVDDEALYLSASSPKALDRAIEILLKLLLDVFTKHGFKINWAPKT
eukprot:9098082-Karenia_brevis.AAC.1